eukprot:TRINITY_DN113105_c0_g1_i1.p1 TRINITY_DN113105_c0_g1~~TRINITY_DN113105_c0_g1_i1.p1  ORF type:complete len:460 (+),score=72.93 TRINITY_DN113105_c0_g1_i1:106-1485(+)
MQRVLSLALLALPTAAGIRVGDEDTVENSKDFIAQNLQPTPAHDEFRSLDWRFGKSSSSSLMQETGMENLTQECNGYMNEIGCSWTEIYYCPGQPPSKLAEEPAEDDDTLGYHCCCGPPQLWKIPMCCACEDGQISWSQSGSCNHCRTSGIIEDRRPQDNICGNPADESQGPHCADICVQMFQQAPPRRNAAGEFSQDIQAAVPVEQWSVTGWIKRNGWWYWLVDGVVKGFSMVTGIDLPGVVAGLMKSVIQTIVGAGVLMGKPPFNCGQKLNALKGGLGLIFLVTVSFILGGAVFAASGGPLTWPALGTMLVSATASMKIYKVLKAFIHAVGGTICGYQGDDWLQLAREIPRTLLRGGFALFLAMSLIPGAPDFPDDWDEETMSDMMKKADLAFTDGYAAIKDFKNNIMAVWAGAEERVMKLVAKGLKLARWLGDRLLSMGESLSISARVFLRLKAAR